mgnify:CR=1 FL=1
MITFYFIGMTLGRFLSGVLVNKIPPKKIIVIGNESNGVSQEIQDMADSNSIYETLEKQIIPHYYEKDKDGLSSKWIKMMKETIATNGGRYSTARMLVDYTNQLYMPLCNLTKKYYQNLEEVTNYNAWKQDLVRNWKDIKISQENNINDVTLDAGTKIEVRCQVELPNISQDSVRVEAYIGKIKQDGTFEKVSATPMSVELADQENKTYRYYAEIEFPTGGNYGYTFRVMPKNEMLLESENLNLVKWITQ